MISALSCSSRHWRKLVMAGLLNWLPGRCDHRSTHCGLEDPPTSSFSRKNSTEHSSDKDVDLCVWWLNHKSRRKWSHVNTTYMNGLLRHNKSCEFLHQPRYTLPKHCTCSERSPPHWFCSTRLQGHLLFRQQSIKLHEIFWNITGSRKYVLNPKTAKFRSYLWTLESSMAIFKGILLWATTEILRFAE